MRRPPGAAGSVGNTSRASPASKAPMPSRKAQLAVYEADRWHCRYCQIEVIAPEALARLVKLLTPYGTAPLWGPRDADRNAALLNLSASCDHVAPRAEIKFADEMNLVTACAFCQFGKGGASLDFLHLHDPRDRAPINDDWDGLRRVLAIKPPKPTPPPPSDDDAGLENLGPGRTTSRSWTTPTLPRGWSFSASRVASRAGRPAVGSLVRRTDVQGGSSACCGRPVSRCSSAPRAGGTRRPPTPFGSWPAARSRPGASRRSQRVPSRCRWGVAGVGDTRSAQGVAGDALTERMRRSTSGLLIGAAHRIHWIARGLPESSGHDGGQFGCPSGGNKMKKLAIASIVVLAVLAPSVVAASASSPHVSLRTSLARGRTT